jgi:hypothetical protein
MPCIPAESLSHDCCLPSTLSRRSIQLWVDKCAASCFHLLLALEQESDLLVNKRLFSAFRVTRLLAARPAPTLAKGHHHEADVRSAFVIAPGFSPSLIPSGTPVERYTRVADNR